MSAIYADISGLPEDEQERIRAEFAKSCWEEMDERNCKTALGEGVVHSEIMRRYHREEYKAGML